MTSPGGSIGGGGGHVEAGNCALDSAIGQPVAGTVADGGYTLCSGFWCSVVAPAYEVHIFCL